MMSQIVVIVTSSRDHIFTSFITSFKNFLRQRIVEAITADTKIMRRSLGKVFLDLLYRHQHKKKELQLRYSEGLMPVYTYVSFTNSGYTLAGNIYKHESA